MSPAVQLRLDQEVNREPGTTFQRLCRRVAGRTGPGLTLDEIRDLGALARELQSAEPDPEKVALFCRRLDLDPGRLP